MYAFTIAVIALHVPAQQNPLSLDPGGDRPTSGPSSGRDIFIGREYVNIGRRGRGVQTFSPTVFILGLTILCVIAVVAHNWI